MSVLNVLAVGVSVLFFGIDEHTGSGAAIPDNSPAGVSSNIEVIDSFPVVDVDVIVEGLTHPWCGDITIRLTHNSRSAVLVQRIGQIDSPTNTGDSSDYGGDYRFNVDAGGNLWTAAGAVGPSGIIAPGEYRPSGQLSGGTNNLSLNTFDNLDSAGTWTLIVSDSAGTDIGSFTGWTLILDRLSDPICMECADSNCDETITVADIGYFVKAVAGGQSQWDALFGAGGAPCNFICANDMNSDNAVTVADIGLFVQAIVTGTANCGP